MDQIPKTYARNSKDARLTIEMLLHLLKFSINMVESTESKRLQEQESMEVHDIKSSQVISNASTDNVLYVLLYLDALVMVNIDIVKKFSLYSQCLLGFSFVDLLFSIINSRHLADSHKEVASHVQSAVLGFENPECKEFDKVAELLGWIYTFTTSKKRDNCLTSNLMLLLSIDACAEYFVGQFERENLCLKEIFYIMIKENNYNTIYESLFCIWNISNSRNLLWLFDNKHLKYLENIVQVIKTNKVDKIARIGLMIIRVRLRNNYSEPPGQ
jgi:hypothetical protein